MVLPSWVSVDLPHQADVSMRVVSMSEVYCAIAIIITAAIAIIIGSNHYKH